ncbi:MAG: Tfp pilus assembly protein FimT/FimU [Thermoanaerobaculia bacterium]
MKNPVSVRGPRGFTVIEMLVVMSLMLVLVALGIPALITALHQSKIRGIAQEVTVLMRQARLDAVKTSTQGVVQIIPSTGAGDPGHVLAFSDRDSNGKLDAGEPVLGNFPLPTGVVFEDCNGKVDKDSIEGFSADPNGGPNMAIFRRDGSISDIGGLRFNDPYDNCMEIHVEPAATARIEARKWNGTAYVPSGDNGKAWTWS